MVNKSDKINRFIKGILHFFQFRYSRGYGVHSPAAFEFVSKVLFDTIKYQDYTSIEQQVNELKKCSESIEIEEHGAGSGVFKSNQRMVKDISRHAGTERKIGRLLYRMARYYQPDSIVELGTSLGISTMYLAMGGGEKTKVCTIEANETLVKYARKCAENLNLKNIDFRIGTFDNELGNIDKLNSDSGIVFIDGNHTCDATLRYFNFFNQRIKKGFIIIDDIYWTHDMEKAWMEIKQSSEVTFDLYSVGIILKGEMLSPHKYKISF
jgi:predicted O-methyltransferase YrrM